MPMNSFVINDGLIISICIQKIAHLDICKWYISDILHFASGRCSVSALAYLFKKLRSYI